MPKMTQTVKNEQGFKHIRLTAQTLLCHLPHCPPKELRVPGFSSILWSQICSGRKTASFFLQLRILRTQGKELDWQTQLSFDVRADKISGLFNLAIAILNRSYEIAVLLTYFLVLVLICCFSAPNSCCLPWFVMLELHPIQLKYRIWFTPWIRTTPWRRECHPTPVFFPGQSHGQRSLAGYSPWGHKRVRHEWLTLWRQNASESKQDLGAPVVIYM